MKSIFLNRHRKRSPRSLAESLADVSLLNGIQIIDNEVSGGIQTFFLAEKRGAVIALEKQRP